MPSPAAHRPAPLPDSSVAERFEAGVLPADEWSHEAHLLAALTLLDREGDPVRVLPLLRRLITAHNDRVGVPADRPGYHETITRYYVDAVAAARPASLAVLIDDPSCARDAPYRHWSPAVLGSERARRSWVEPDLAPLPWPTPD